MGQAHGIKATSTGIPFLRELMRQEKYHEIKLEKPYIPYAVMGMNWRLQVAGVYAERVLYLRLQLPQ